MKPISDQERKGCLGKAQHKSVLAAQNALEQLKKYSRTPEHLNFYKCDFCKNFHVGNKKNKKK